MKVFSTNRGRVIVQCHSLVIGMSPYSSSIRVVQGSIKDLVSAAGL